MTFHLTVLFRRTLLNKRIYTICNRTRKQLSHSWGEIKIISLTKKVFKFILEHQYVKLDLVKSLKCEGAILGRVPPRHYQELSLKGVVQD